MKKLLYSAAVTLLLVFIAYHAAVALALRGKEVALAVFLVAAGIVFFGMLVQRTLVFPAWVAVLITFATYLKLADWGGTVRSPVSPVFVVCLGILLLALGAAKDLRLRFLFVLPVFAVEADMIYFLLIR